MQKGTVLERTFLINDLNKHDEIYQEKYHQALKCGFEIIYSNVNRQKSTITVQIRILKSDWDNVSFVNWMFKHGVESKPIGEVKIISLEPVPNCIKEVQSLIKKIEDHESAEVV